MQFSFFKRKKLILFLMFSFTKTVIFLLILKIRNAQSSDVADKIVGGLPADAGEFPFMASVFIFNSNTCGCTILNSEWALTAARCVYKYTTSDYIVHAGSTHWPSGEAHQVVERRIHPGYVNSAADNWPHNVALLRVSPPFQFDGDLIQPVALARPDSEVEAGSQGLVAGWGSTYSGGLLQDDLFKAEIPVFTEEECRQQVPENNVASNLTICAGGSGTGICVGDTGGPLTVDGMQVGVTSWYPATCSERPAIFTKVSNYYNWISENSILTTK